MKIEFTVEELNKLIANITVLPFKDVFMTIQFLESKYQQALAADAAAKKAALDLVKPSEEG